MKDTRLDFYILSSHMSDIIKSCDIKVGYRSDHSRVDLEILLSNFTRGRGLWKFNNSLLKNKNYVDLINPVIEEETIKYAVPVYDYSFLKNYCLKLLPKYISQYYQNLFKIKDDGLENLNLFETFGNIHIKVSDTKLGEPITVMN